MAFIAELELVIETARGRLYHLIKKHGEPSQFNPDWKCIKITDDNNRPFLETGAFLSEITDEHLVDEYGRYLSHYSLETRKLIELIDYLVEKYG